MIGRHPKTCLMVPPSWGRWTQKGGGSTLDVEIDRTLIDALGIPERLVEQMTPEERSNVYDRLVEAMQLHGRAIMLLYGLGEKDEALPSGQVP